MAVLALSAGIRATGGGWGAAGIEVAATGGVTATGCPAAPVSRLLAAATGSTVSTGRVPVSPARRLAKVSSLSAGTSMVCGTMRGAAMRSIDTMM